MSRELIAKGREILTKLENDDTLDKVAELYAEAIANDGLVHLYANGHSAITVYETFPRIGSMVGFHPIIEQSLVNYSQVVGLNGLRSNQYLERLEGFAEQILCNFDFGPHDVFTVVSSTGINGVAIDMALGAKERGMKVVAITSVAHQIATESRHSSGKRLCEIADLVIDNCTPPGDAMIKIEGLDYNICPGSSIAGVTIAQTLNELTAQELLKRGVKPLVLPSMHFKGDDSVNDVIDNYYAETKRRYQKL